MPDTPVCTTYLLSYPRSGNHWLRFMIEFLSGMPTRGCVRNPRDVPICENRFEGAHPLEHVRVDRGYVGVKAHSVQELVNAERLVFLVRSYRECVPRHAEYRAESFRSHLRHYVQLVAYYQAFRGPKLLVAYRDLVRQPSRILESLRDFFEFDCDERRSDLLENIADYAALSRSAKNRMWLGSVSESNLTYHYDRLEVEARRLLESAMDAALADVDVDVRLLVDRIAREECDLHDTG